MDSPLAAKVPLLLREPLPPPSVVGHYRLLKRIGAGGMGEVYLAEHQALGRQVAIKLLNGAAVRNPDLVHRLFAEAKVVSEINHENIVEVFDFGAGDDGQSYLVMELLRGLDLAAARAARGPFTVAQTVHIARQMCRALAAAHAKGVIHRDLKPENVFVIERGGDPSFVKLLDFGIAKLLGDGFGIGRATQAGLIVGTPEFMSPEQAGGREVDGRSDIYALGVILHWMLSDELPFRGSGFDKLILVRLTTDPPALPARTPSGEALPRRLAALVRRCLDRRPEGRYRDMAELEAALAGIDLSPAAPPRRARRGMALVAGGLALGGTAAILALHRPRPAPAAHVEPVAASPVVEAAPAEPPAVEPPAVAPAPKPPKPARSRARAKVPPASQLLDPYAGDGK